MKMEGWSLRDPKLNLSEEELFREIQLLKGGGFMYLQKWQINAPRTPDRYKLPSGKILDEDELLGFLMRQDLNLEIQSILK